MQHNEINIKTLTDNQLVDACYSDSDMVVVDSIQQFAEVSTARMSMTAIVICLGGRVQGQMNGLPIELSRNQVAVIPASSMITDIMISPDFNLKGLFLTNKILQSFLHEKMKVWCELMYVRKLHILDLSEDDIRFFTYFYDMLLLSIEKGKVNPYGTEIVQSLLRSAILALCGSMQQTLPPSAAAQASLAGNGHFQRFLHLLNRSNVHYRSVEWYASELCLSPKYLSVVCKKHSGKTANEWITEHVMEDIRYYLCQSDLSIKQVSSRLGFPNPSFFGKYVKEHFGVTPLHLRQHRV